MLYQPKAANGGLVGVGDDGDKLPRLAAIAVCCLVLLLCFF